MELGLLLADVVHEGGVNPRHKRGDGFPGVVGRPIASPTNLELQASGCRGVRTLSQDLRDGIVVLLCIVVVRISLTCGIVQGHMLATEVGFSHTELTLVALPELSVTHFDAVGVLTNPADHLSGCEPGFGAVGAHAAGSDHPHRVSHPEILRCRAQGGLLTLSMLFLVLLADVSRRRLLPRQEFLCVHGHTITRQGKSPTKGVPAEQNLVRGQTTLEHSLSSSSQFGGLPNHRCTDQIFSMISNLSTDPDLYHLYLDLNKAFNSVPHQTLFQILRNYNFPPFIITLIQQLYSYPADPPPSTITPYTGQ